MKIEFENSVRRLSFLCHLPDIKIAWINPCKGNKKNEFSPFWESIGLMANLKLSERMSYPKENIEVH